MKIVVDVYYASKNDINTILDINGDEEKVKEYNMIQTFFKVSIESSLNDKKNKFTDEEKDKVLSIMEEWYSDDEKKYKEFVSDMRTVCFDMNLHKSNTISVILYRYMESTRILMYSL